MKKMEKGLTQMKSIVIFVLTSVLLFSITGCTKSELKSNRYQPDSTVESAKKPKTYSLSDYNALPASNVTSISQNDDGWIINTICPYCGTISHVRIDYKSDITQLGGYGEWALGYASFVHTFEVLCPQAHPVPTYFFSVEFKLKH